MDTIIAIEAVDQPNSRELACSSFAEETHRSLQELPHLIDSKVEIFLAIVFAALIFQARMLAKSREGAAGPLLVALDHIPILAGLAVIFLAAAVLGCVFVIWPRLSSTGKGLTYFGDIASRRSAAIYAEDVLRLNEEALVRELLVHSFDLAHVVRSKVIWCRLSIGCGVVGFVLMALSDIFIRF